MKICYWVDHTVAFSSNTGMQRVTRLLARSLLDLGCELTFVCWDAERRALRTATATELEELARFGGPDVRRVAAHAARAGAPVPSEGLAGRWLIVPEVTYITYHAQAPTRDLLAYVSRYGMKTAWVFYDAVPLRMPGYEELRETHANYLRALTKGDVILPISRFSEGELLALWGEEFREHRRKVSVQELPGEFIDRRRVTAIEERPVEGIRILSVGSIEPRKHHLRLLSAFDRLLKEMASVDVQLTLIGHIRRELEAPIQQMTRANPKVRHVGYVDDKRLVDEYDRASFTVFPSVFEGFGLPILESLWHAKPCVCANFGAMAEVAAEGGCLMVDTYFASEIFTAMKSLIQAPALRLRLAREAAERRLKTWRDYGRGVVAALEESHADPRLG